MAYNGWKNYETWNVALWLDNDCGTESMMGEWAQECWDEALDGKYMSREDNAKSALSDRIKEFVEEQNPLADQATMFTDLLNAALGEVDWYEIAEHYLSEVEKETQEEEVSSES